MAIRMTRQITRRGFAALAGGFLLSTKAVALTEFLRLDLGFLREKRYPAKPSCFSRLGDFSLRSRSRIASST
jgi:hypothetical protein